MQETKLFLNLVKSNQIWYCNYTFPVDLAPIRIPFNAKLIEKLKSKSEYWPNSARFSYTYLCLSLTML